MLKLMLRFLLMLKVGLLVSGNECTEVLDRPGSRRDILYIFDVHDLKWTPLLYLMLRDSARVLPVLGT